MRAHRPDVIFLFETLSHLNKVHEVKRSLQFKGVFAIDKEGRGGGVCGLWRDSGLVYVTGNSRNQIDVEVLDQDVGRWRFIGFYGIPEGANCRAL